MRKHILNVAKPGEVWALALGDGEYGYTRIFRGSCLGVLPAVSKGIVNDANEMLRFPAKWFFGFAAPPTDSTEMVRIGVVTFASEDEAWCPPRFSSPNMFNGHFRIWYKGVQRQADEKEVRDLQEAKTSTPEWLRKFILDHRSEFACVKGSTFSPKPFGPNSQCPERILLEIVFQNAEFPFPGRDVVEEPLAQALNESGMGEVIGGGCGPETCAIDVEVSELEHGLKIIRATLRALGLPKSTEIRQQQPKQIVYRL